MATYTTQPDGQKIVATHNADFVRKLQAASQAGRGVSAARFMQQTAARVRTATGKHVATTSATAFVKSLVAADLLKIAEEQNQ